jgi:hypothetical protein
MQITGMLKEVQMLPGAFDRIVNQASLALGVGEPAATRKADAQVQFFATWVQSKVMDALFDPEFASQQKWGRFFTQEIPKVADKGETFCWRTSWTWNGKT